MLNFPFSSELVPSENCASLKNMQWLFAFGCSLGKLTGNRIFLLRKELKKNVVDLREYPYLDFY